jgi:hypothetical protein
MPDGTPAKTGPTNAMHDWVHAAFGVHPNNSAASKASGLPAAGSDQQSQNFHNALQQQLSVIDGHLAFTADYAEAAKHQPMQARRATVVAAYQPAAAQIDPADPAKAKPAIDQALATAQAVASQVAQFRQATEKDWNDWQAHQAKFETAVGQIDEMQAWGHAKAPDLLGSVDAIKPLLDAHSYAAACTAVDQLMPKLQPAYADFQAQKAAQAQYEPARTALEPRLTAAAISKYKKMEPLQQPLAPATAAMDAAATSKDFVHALQMEGDLTTQVTAYETAFAALDAQRQAYETEKQALQPRLDQATDVPKHKTLMPLMQDIQAGRDLMIQTAEAEDFDKALGMAKDLGVKSDGYNTASATLDQQKQEFDDAYTDDLKKRAAATAQSSFKQLEPPAAEITDLQTQITAAADEERYSDAKTIATTLSTKCDAYEATKKQLEEAKQKFDDARAKMQDQLAAIGKPPHPKLKVDEDDIAKSVTAMDAEATAERFDSALAMAGDVSQKLTKHDSDVEAIAAAKVKYEAAYQPAADMLKEINASRNDSLAAMQQAAQRLDEEIAKQVADEDYDGAAKNAELLVRQLQDLRDADNQQLLTITIPGEAGGGTYTGTMQEIAAIRSQIQTKMISGRIEPLTRSATYHNDYLRDLEQNGKGNPVVMVVAAIFNNFVGDLGSVRTACAKQMPAIDALRQAVNSCSGDAQGKFEEAINAVNGAGAALQTFLTAIDSGAQKALPVLIFTRDASFFLLAALAAPAVAGAATASLGATGAGMAGAAASAAISELGKKAEKFDDLKEVTLGEIVWDVSREAAIGAVTKYLGGEMAAKYGKSVSTEVCAILKVSSPAITAKVEAFIAKHLEDKTKKIVKEIFDPKTKKTTWAEIAKDVANDFAKDQLKDLIKDWAKEKLKEEAGAG